MTLVEWTPTKGWSCSGAPFYSKPAVRRQQRECAAHSQWLPATDIYDTKDNYIFTMEVPGFSKDEIKMEYKEGTLLVKGERKAEAQADNKEEATVEVKTAGDDVIYHRNERPKGNFSRSFRVPKNVDGKKIEARLKDGILELKVAKPEEKKPKQIPINFS